MAWIDPSERLLPRGRHKDCNKPYVKGKVIITAFFCYKCNCTSPRSNKCMICGNKKKQDEE